jgi:hypothetical protein
MLSPFFFCSFVFFVVNLCNSGYSAICYTSIGVPESGRYPRLTTKKTKEQKKKGLNNANTVLTPFPAKGLLFFL